MRIKEKKCNWCSKTLHLLKNNAKYCNRNCYLKHKQSLGKIIIKCKTCNKEFKLNKSYYNWIVKNRKITPKFCSKKCSNTIIIDPIIQQNCINLYKTHSIKLLSQKYNISEQSIKKILLQNGIKIRKQGTTIYNNTKINGHSIKTKCLLRNIANKIYKERPELKEILRKKTLEQLQNGLMPHTYTTIERKIENILIDMKIKYIHNFAFGHWSYDFYIPKYKLFIECDGDYWHANPRIYKILNKIQKKNVNNDIKKEKYASKCGYKLIRFWESDINKNLNLIIKKIKNIKYDNK